MRWVFFFLEVTKILHYLVVHLFLFLLLLCILKALLLCLHLWSTNSWSTWSWWFLFMILWNTIDTKITWWWMVPTNRRISNRSCRWFLFQLIHVLILTIHFTFIHLCSRRILCCIRWSGQWSLKSNSFSMHYDTISTHFLCHFVSYAVLSFTWSFII